MLRREKEAMYLFIHTHKNRGGAENMARMEGGR